MTNVWVGECACVAGLLLRTRGGAGYEAIQRRFEIDNDGVWLLALLKRTGGVSEPHADLTFFPGEKITGLFVQVIDLRPSVLVRSVDAIGRTHGAVSDDSTSNKDLFQDRKVVVQDQWQNTLIHCACALFVARFEKVPDVRVDIAVMR